MTSDNGSEQKEKWPKRTAEQRRLFSSKQKLLEILPYLSKLELQKCREVCDWTDWLIDKCTGRELKQRRELWGLTIVPDHQFDDLDLDPRMTRLDIDKWLEDEENIAKIKAKAQEFIGETIYLYEPDEAMVRIEIAPEFGHFLYVDVKNRLDEGGALLMARLMPRITPPTAVFTDMQLLFSAIPELPADAPHGGSYLNPAIFSSGADGDGGGQTKLTARDLSMIGMRGESPRGMISTAERTVCCQELYLVYSPTHLFLFYDFLQQVAVARPLNASAKIIARGMEDGRLDEILGFFTDEVPNCESAAPHLRVTIDETAAWPESLPKERAVNEREQQLAEGLYVFRLYNTKSGEKLKVEVHGSFGDGEQEGGCCEENEECLRVEEMVLHFRPDYDDK